jgi:hypothetical protein
MTHSSSSFNATTTQIRALATLTGFVMFTMKFISATIDRDVYYGKAGETWVKNGR